MLLAWGLGGAALLLLIGLYALLTARNLVRLLIGLELAAKSVVLSFVVAGAVRGELAVAQCFVISFIVAEVALIAVALALVINAYRTTGSLDVRGLASLKG